MRIVAGSLGGRTFEAPKGNRTHPMGDKIRGALFNILGDLQGLTVLDAFAGSGAISLEAISRGARNVTAIETDPAAVATIKQNAVALKVAHQMKIIRANASSWSDNNSSASFDVVICDPPYDHVQTELLVKLATHTKSGGIVVLSLPPDTRLELPARYGLLSSKVYGDATLTFYRLTSQ